MSWCKRELSGTGKVFSFTLKQMVCSRANIISIVILLLMSLLSMPVMTMMNADDSSDTTEMSSETEIVKVYYTNETAYQVDFQKLAAQDEAFRNTPIEKAEFSKEECSKYLQEEEALVVLSEEIKGEATVPQIQVYGSDETGEDYSNLVTAAENLLQEARYEAAGITAEQIAIASSYYESSTATVGEYYESQSETDSGTAFIVQYSYAMILMILSIFTVSYIIRAVIEEKASKLVELLMVSVKPLALIMGKILAVMLYVFGMLLAMGICMVISFVVSAGLFGTGIDLAAIFGMGISLGTLNINPFVIAAVLISLLLGYLTFSILSGLAGAGCSSMEDMEGANMSITLIIIAAYMISIFTLEIPGMANVVSVVPILATFCAPVAYACGNIGIGMLIISWVVQGAVAALLFLFCSKVYKDLILYKGRRMKWGEIFRLAGSMKKEGKHGKNI